MKKNILIFPFLFLIIIIKSQQEEQKQFEYEVIYNFSFVQDSTINVNSEQKMALYIGNHYSLFQNENKKSIDSLSHEKVNHENDFFIDLSKIRIPRSYLSIYKMYDENKIIFTDRIGNTNIGYIDNFDDLKWKVTNEKRKIQNYNATKATLEYRGRHYTAWYTDEIPFQDGPYKFSKLPGLILEIEDSKSFFKFSLLSLRKIKTQVWYKPSFVDIDRKKYYETKINYHNSLINNPMQKGKIKIINSYNPIELK